MTASQQCKAAGLKSLAQLSEITKTPRGTLNEWHSSNQDRFRMAIDAALYRLAKSESLQGNNMGEVIQLSAKESEKYQVDYQLDENKKVVGVTHPDWNFSISRNSSGTHTAFAMNDDTQAFGELESKQFNTVLFCWILIDQPELVPDVEQLEKKIEAYEKALKEIIGLEFSDIQQSKNIALNAIDTFN